ncbi:hypothetical protein CDD83_11066 [Cordyceps sp. RAO-2017]|nr:hypothetical protein CDD83_11066 [Cordyceps sp. RAO-2017]
MVPATETWPSLGQGWDDVTRLRNIEEPRQGLYHLLDHRPRRREHRHRHVHLRCASAGPVKLWLSLQQRSDVCCLLGGYFIRSSWRCPALSSGLPRGGSAATRIRTRQAISRLTATLAGPEGAASFATPGSLGPARMPGDDVDYGTGCWALGVQERSKRAEELTPKSSRPQHVGIRAALVVAGVISSIRNAWLQAPATRGMCKKILSSKRPVCEAQGGKKHRAILRGLEAETVIGLSLERLLGAISIPICT